MIYTIINTNKQYEKELIVQRDKIKRDAEALKDIDELKTRFFANISHELRTPLTLVLSPLESILNSNELSNKNFTYLSLVQQNAQKLLKRINELLELSRLDAKRLEIAARPNNLYQMTKQIMALYEGAANLKKIALNYVNKVPEATNLLLDDAKIEMILSNYLSNALKFTPKNETITLKIEKINTRLQISIQDTGIGIPSESLEQIFNRFYQVKDRDYTGGSGIGLALCKELAELHNGKVWATSELGVGSTFFLELPFEETYAPVTSKPVTASVTTTKATPINEAKQVIQEHLTTVLIVEDNVDLRTYMKLLLAEKYHVITAENGKMALDILENPPNNVEPSVIITDIMMPIMSGMELLNQLKESDNFRHIPVIMLTAQKHSTIKIEALQIGVDDYLTKPFKAAELVARVENLIQNTQQRLATQPTSNTPSKQTTVTKADMVWLKKVEQIILENIENSTFNLNQLATELLITPRTLQQKIKLITGKTPKEYQRAIQMHVARQKIKNGEVSTIAELGFQLGFDNPYYFANLYTKYYGVNPKDDMKNE